MSTTGQVPTHGNRGSRPLALIHQGRQNTARYATANMEYLVRLTELELATRASNALQSRINTANFPVQKELDAFDFTAAPGISKLKMLELSRGAWIDGHHNCILVGSSGTGKTHLAIACGLAACRLGKRVRFFTAASLVQKLEQAQKQFTLERFQKQLDKTDLLICDELGYLSFSPKSQKTKLGNSAGETRGLLSG